MQDQRKTLKELKKQVFGEEEKQDKTPKRKRGKSGPNPLSCMKKKKNKIKKTGKSAGDKTKLSTEPDKTSASKKRRKRRRKNVSDINE